MNIGIEAISRLFSSAFSFSPVLIRRQTYLTSKLQVSKKVTHSGGLMLECRGEGVNALVQNKFHSINHLLSQHLFA